MQYRSVLLRLHFVCRKTRGNERNYQLTSLQTECNLSPPCWQDRGLTEARLTCSVWPSLWRDPPSRACSLPAFSLLLRLSHTGWERETDGDCALCLRTITLCVNTRHLANTLSHWSQTSTVGTALDIEHPRTLKVKAGKARLELIWTNKRKDSLSVMWGLCVGKVAAAPQCPWCSASGGLCLVSGLARLSVAAALL